MPNSVSQELPRQTPQGNVLLSSSGQGQAYILRSLLPRTDPAHPVKLQQPALYMEGKREACCLPRTTAPSTPGSCLSLGEWDSQVRGISVFWISSAQQLKLKHSTRPHACLKDSAEPAESHGAQVKYRERMKANVSSGQRFCRS